MTPENLPQQNAPQFTVWQSHLPQRLGISIDEVRARREALLREGVDWALVGNRVLLTADAEQKLRLSLSLPALSNATAPPSAPEEKAEADQPPALSAQKTPPTAHLVVWRSAPHIRNQRIVEVYAEGSDPAQRENRLLLWVRDNTKFRPGYRIPPTAVEARQPGQLTYIARPPK